jgi:hypothetical protein
LSAETKVPDPRRAFFTLLIVSTVLKLWLAAFFPFTGDEAYFYQWGAHPDWGGFYDHPPMVGWWLWVLQQISSHPLVLRMPAVLLWIAIAFGMMDIYARLLPEQAARRWYLGSLFLALPFTWAFNLITTDTPLVLFLFFSGYAFIRAEHEQQWRWCVASGVLLGLALLSKYFAGLLAITYAIFLLPKPGGIRRLGVVAISALPFMLLNLAWNATHCWNNILFNLFNRNQDAHFSIVQVLLYLLMLLYLVTPWTANALWRCLKTNSSIKRQTKSSSLATGAATVVESEPYPSKDGTQSSRLGIRKASETPIIAVLFIVPFGLFLLLSFYKQIGLHWLLAFIPFVFLYAATQLNDKSLHSYRQWNLWFGLPHLLLILGLMYLPLDSFKALRQHADIVLHRAGGDVVTALRQDSPDRAVLMTGSYSQSSLLSFHGQNYVPVFGFGSFHARFDDPITDFHLLEGRNIRIASTRVIDIDHLKPFFDQITLQEKLVHGARFYVADGEGFRFTPYRAQVLTAIAERFYKAPSWLPYYGCRFLEMYDFI